MIVFSCVLRFYVIYMVWYIVMNFNLDLIILLMNKMDLRFEFELGFYC